MYLPGLDRLKKLEHETGEFAQGDVYLERLLEEMRQADAYLLRQRGTMIGTVPSVDCVLDLLYQPMGNMGQVTSHFEEAFTFCRKADYRPEQA